MKGLDNKIYCDCCGKRIFDEEYSTIIKNITDDCYEQICKKCEAELCT